ncbi:hypothetical protein EJ04DRAFT_514053 [Polyplosphaeria fusca]|uniref:Uncharacterized protein n=1 Tax=Polyplosphaeria fusca TaxID=682080 RepID=A0A9P4QR22_9PLEO|nr:hypothetical protein EJ04DRAFT_514053 [Polyplosphaeria fusca]
MATQQDTGPEPATSPAAVRDLDPPVTTNTSRADKPTTNHMDADMDVGAQVTDKYSNQEDSHLSNSEDGGQPGGRRTTQDRRAAKEAKIKQYKNLPESSNAQEIIDQVEFYFSDANIYADKFLFQKIDGVKNKPVPISLLCTFTRMRHFKPLSAVVEALKKSTALTVIGDTVQRKEPITIVPRDDEEARDLELGKMPWYDQFSCGAPDRHKLDVTLYVRDFGSKKISQLELEKYFKQFGAEAVRMRRFDTGSREWKGSVWVQFRTPKEKEDFQAMKDPKFNGNVLQVESKKDYCERKAHAKGELADWEPGAVPKTPRQSSYRSHGGFRPPHGGSRRPHGGHEDRGFYRNGRAGGDRSSSKYGNGGNRNRNRNRNRSRSRSPMPDNWKDSRDEFQGALKNSSQHPTKREASSPAPEEGPRKKHEDDSKGLEITEDE